MCACPQHTMCCEGAAPHGADVSKFLATRVLPVLEGTRVDKSREVVRLPVRLWCWLVSASHRAAWQPLSLKQVMSAWPDSARWTAAPARLRSCHWPPL